MDIDHYTLARAAADTYADELPAGVQRVLAQHVSVGTLTADITRPAPGVVQIAIAGSNDLGDWLTNLRAWFRGVGHRKQVSTWLGLPPLREADDAPPMVHAGFAAASERLAPVIAAQVQRGDEVHLTGHSLGGVLAIFLAPRLAAKGCTIAQVVTFGAPRVGNAAYVTEWQHVMGDIATRYVYSVDPVARVPLWLRGYRHLGRMVWGGGRGELQRPTWRAQLTDLAGALWWRLTADGPRLDAYHHMGYHYISLAWAHTHGWGDANQER